MAHNQSQSGSHSHGSAHRGGGRKDDRRSDGQGDGKSSKRVDNKSSAGSAQSASSSKDHHYDPQYDPHYAPVARPMLNDFTHLANAVNNPALSVGILPSHEVVDASRSGPDAVRRSFGSSGFSAPRAGQAHQVQYAMYPPQAQQAFHLSSGYDHTGPYNAIGHVRVNGQVYEDSELYEEYRPCDQGEELDDNHSGDWYNVGSNVSY
ncbi:hypothetical protein COCMIDRAFT_89864 [Bipolaris oryzae ATCC 44560]|uniref:Uncharacterized protein n=1 Tax=Bipolaris oryzae ATCC 44560 TaxID=930090 RepID=W6ZJC4_COCMI|nr:uncharacterized protein COCMIDRAFT_89864 [Bipolaris oryzae ATCC 44560]EUC47574.1 hypothetical protein COCMIDRAFT_89864 [Bipolaris oryzae ATCC 44560]